MPRLFCLSWQFTPSRRKLLVGLAKVNQNTDNTQSAISVLVNEVHLQSGMFAVDSMLAGSMKMKLQKFVSCPGNFD